MDVGSKTSFKVKYDVLYLPRILKSKITYTILFAASAAVAFLKNLLYAFALEPAKFGVVALALLIVTFCSYLASPGILEALVREVPMLRGQGKDVQLYRSAALTMVCMLSFIVGSILTLIIAVYSLSVAMFTGLIWSGPLLVVTVILNGIFCDLQIREYSIEYSLMLFLKSILPLVIIVLLPRPLNASEVLIAETCSMLLCIVTSFFIWSNDLTWCFDFQGIVKRLLNQGIPFTLSNLCQNVTMNIDRWAVQLSLGSAALGTYTFTMTFTTFALVLINMIQTYEIPRILSLYGKTNDTNLAIKKTKLIAVKAGIFFLLIAFPIYLLFPWGVAQWFPEYVEGNNIVVWSFIGALLVATASFSVLFRIYGDGKALLYFQGILFFIALISCWGVTKIRPSLTVFVIIFAALRFLNLWLGWWIGIRKLRNLNLCLHSP